MLFVICATISHFALFLLFFNIAQFILISLIFQLIILLQIKKKYSLNKTCYRKKFSKKFKNLIFLQTNLKVTHQNSAVKLFQPSNITRYQILFLKTPQKYFLTLLNDLLMLRLLSDIFIDAKGANVHQNASQCDSERLKKS